MPDHERLIIATLNPDQNDICPADGDMATTDAVDHNNDPNDDSLREKLLEYGQMRQANIGATALALRNSPRYQEILRARRNRLRNWNYYGRFY